MTSWAGLYAAVLLLTGAVAVPGAVPAQRAAPEAVPPPATTPASAAPVRYTAPVTPVQVDRPFQPPASAYGPGHRGVDLAVPAGAAVHAAGPGVVSFAGPVAGRGVVVITHPDGLRTEYEPVTPVVRTGDVVPAGADIGTVTGAHNGCATGGCLHWGLRRGRTYLDPLTLLTRLGPVRLLPWR